MAGNSAKRRLHRVVLPVPDAAEIKSKSEIKLGELLEKIQPEDLLKFGLIPEFIGRLPVLATLHELTKDALVDILTTPKNSLVKQFQKLFELDGVNAPSPRLPSTRWRKRRWSERVARVAFEPFWKRRCSKLCTKSRPKRASRRSS